ncbi:hypothetical protein AVEN_189516-1 [Araneus ventricosus]|uniref:Uncharacterized protein n=1 Tax=Araneus ventricosus TaxID=182803 RepID=A0A4Y2QKM3_ARAVE|nr:hypothetical protein AVEN_189516-1 [Araneus ventricosus]
MCKTCQNLNGVERNSHIQPSLISITPFGLPEAINTAVIDLKVSQYLAGFTCNGFLLMSTSKVTRLRMHLLKHVLMMLQCLLHLSPTWSCSLDLKAVIELSDSFHRCITGIKVLDQVAAYQLTATDATKQLLLASLVGISEV